MNADQSCSEDSDQGPDWMAAGANHHDQLCSQEVLAKISESLYTKLYIQNIFTVEIEIKGIMH